MDYGIEAKRQRRSRDGELRSGFFVFANCADRLLGFIGPRRGGFVLLLFMVATCK